MLSTAEDFIAIQQLLALHGHLIDGREFERLGELFTADAVYDVSARGLGLIGGRDDSLPVRAGWVVY